MKNKNKLFIDMETDKQKEWVGMPEYINNNIQGYQHIVIHFDNEMDVQNFAKLINQKILPTTNSMYYPLKKPESYADMVYIDSHKKILPKYPLYIISKGRWDSRLTSKALESMGVPYYIVIEKQEYKKYKSVIDKKKILILPQCFLDDYDTFDNLENTKSKGPGAARNFCWEHSIQNGFKRHWVMDDNIRRFLRFNRNYTLTAKTGAVFRCMEDFVDRYKNIAMAGPQYYMFIARKVIYPVYVLNTRIYSCNLILNSVPYRWRGRYNEDTDLSLRMLKDKWCTVQFNAFLQEKAPTQTIKGGNTKEFYAKEGTLPKSQMLKDMHPELTDVVWKFGRWHHNVYYNKFKKTNRLIKKKKFQHIEGINNYGMKIVNIKEEK